MSCCDGTTPRGGADNNDAGDRLDKRENESSVSGSELSVRWFVRSMRHEDIDRCLEIWLQVELTEARVTVANLLTIDPAGFYVAELESNGEVIGMCSGVMARQDTAFMGFYAVSPAYQGLGIGRELWARTVARLDKSISNIGLYGVPSMSEKYKKSGFKVEDSIRMLIFESEPYQQLQTSQLKCLNNLCNIDDESLSGDRLRIELVIGEQLNNETIFCKLIEYDKQVHGHSREILLRNYLLEADELPLTVAIVQRMERGKVAAGQRREEMERKSSCSNVSRRQSNNVGTLTASVKSSLSISEIARPFEETGDIGSKQNSVQDGEPTVESDLMHLLGYGCIRHDNTGGAMIGPLYAKSSDACEVILRELIERFDMRPGGKYSVMSLTSNEQADTLLRLIGLQEMDQCSRMFTKFIPEAALDQIYYVHSPNFTLF